MQPEVSYHDFAELRAQTAFLSLLISLFSFLILAASAFSFPFPFVRPFWIGEALGLTGIANGIFFMLLARQMEKMSLPAAVGGLGLILNDQIFAWRGFHPLLLNHHLQKNAAFFMAGSVAADLFLFFYFPPPFILLPGITLQKSGQG